MCEMVSGVCHLYFCKSSVSSRLVSTIVIKFGTIQFVTQTVCPGQPSSLCVKQFLVCPAISLKQEFVCVEAAYLRERPGLSLGHSHGYGQPERARERERREMEREGERRARQEAAPIVHCAGALFKRRHWAERVIRVPWFCVD